MLPQPREEARNLVALIGRNGNTVESIRQLIAVPANIEQALKHYARLHPQDAEGVEIVLEFRRLVAKEFDRLVRGRPRLDLVNA